MLVSTGLTKLLLLPSKRLTAEHLYLALPCFPGLLFWRETIWLGSPSTIDLHMCMINEDVGPPDGQWSYAAVPSNSFVDSKDPDYEHYFHFDRSSSTAPNDYSPM